MRPINKPLNIPEDFYFSCLGNVEDIGLKGRLEAVKPLIATAAQEFDSKVTQGKLHTIVRESIVNGNVTKKELENVYTQRMVPQKSLGRNLYNKIRNSPKHGVCPFCAHRNASTVDHYLPKTEYPRLTVVPINLIPCCKDCNDIKHTFYPTQPFHELIHPYYDDIENQIWLTASLQHSNPCVVIFSVTPHVTWSPLLTERVKFHFNKLKLNQIYSIQAAVEISQINKMLRNRFISGGVDAVRLFLKENEETRADDYVNSWQAAFYRAAATDDWFCNGGFIY